MATSFTIEEASSPAAVSACSTPSAVAPLPCMPGIHSDMDSPCGPLMTMFTVPGSTGYTVVAGRVDDLMCGPGVALDLIRAQRAATFHARHYDRASRPISLADAILVASAGPGDRIATADPDVLAVAEAEAITTISLPTQD